MIDEKLRQRVYYESHKGEISSYKKKKYEEDAQYRAAIRKRAMEKYYATRKEGGGMRGKRGYNRPKILALDGQDVLVHCVREFADKARRNIQTIRAWEEKKIIPPATFVDEHNRRWYSDKHIERVARAVAKFEATGALSLDVLRKLVEREFK